MITILTVCVSLAAGVDNRSSGNTSVGRHAARVRGRPGTYAEAAAAATIVDRTLHALSAGDA